MHIEKIHTGGIIRISLLMMYLRKELVSIEAIVKPEQKKNIAHPIAPPNANCEKKLGYMGLKCELVISMIAIAFRVNIQLYILFSIIFDL